MDYKDFFAEIDRHLFPNTDVKQISEMNDDEQRAFMLQQVDKAAPLGRNGMVCEHAVGRERWRMESTHRITSLRP